jgi:hypothetical protein
MAKPPALVVSALATWNGKALAKGSKQISEFDKTAQKLGKTFAKYLGATALVAFGKSSVNAFIESEKAAAKLRTTVNNLGLSFEQRAIDDYLKRLSLQYGIIDENLIPGFQRLLIVTKDVAAAQSIFQTALDVSAGTGKDLTSVSTSLSKAYLGDNVALGRLGVGLSKAQLKSSSFLDVQKTLNSNFSGQASAAVAGYAGDMAKLTVAVDESKEAIGKGLLDALRTLSGDTSIDSFTAKMVSLADTLGRFINNAAGFAKVTANIFNVKDPNFFRIQPKTVAPGASTTRVKDYQLTVKTTAARKAELAILTASNKTRSEIDKLKDKFDLERIGLTAALNAATDEETKLRIRAQLAILDNNEALAKKINAELEAVKATDQLKTAFNIFSGSILELSSTLNSQNKALQDEKMGKNSYITYNSTSTTPYVPPAPTYEPFTGSIDELSSTLNSINKATQDEKIGKNSYVINIDASNMVDANNMNQLVQHALLSIQKEGSSTTYAGSI